MKPFLRPFSLPGLLLAAALPIAATAVLSQSQTARSQIAQQTDEAGEAPTNPYAAQSPWGHFHGNGYAQASTSLRGPEANDSIEAHHIPLSDWGGTPTQMHISERYPDGARTVWSTTLTSIVKARVSGDDFSFVDGYKMDERILDGSVHWNMQLGRDNKAFVPDPKNRAILRFGDRNPTDSRSDIVLEDTFVLPDESAGKPIVINLTYDGWVVFLTTGAWIGAVKTDFSEYRTFDLGSVTNDKTIHNSFPVDENGGIYVVSHTSMYKVRWTGNSFELKWRSPYNFRGPGCPPPSENAIREIARVFTGQSCTGSGTTPTLMGRGSMDKLVLAVDSHETNNLVAFWRDEIPEDWSGLPGRDRRIAAVLPLPYSTWAGAGFTAENSPPVSGYNIAIAQYAGFNPGCRSPRGVQMARWNPDQNNLSIAWTNANVQFNNIMSISTGSNLLYGVGRGEQCKHTYRGLDLDSGEAAFSLPLSRTRDYLDQGNSHAINDDRSIIFGTATGMARVRPKEP